MKRSSPLWLVLILFGLLLWIRAVRSSAPPPPAPVMVHELVDPEGRMRKVHEYRDGKYAVVVADDVDDPDPSRGVRREPAEGLPVPVVPGSRTTEARAETPRPSHPSRRPPRHLVQATPVPEPPSADVLTVTGRLSATPERATADARARLERVLSERLAPEVPRGWKVPAVLLDGGMIRRTVTVPRTRDYGTVYEATIEADFSPSWRAEVVAAYHREQVVKRLVTLGAVLAFVLAVLAAVSGYIKADEATRGYYTTRLRLAAAAGVGAAGVAIYRMFA